MPKTCAVEGCTDRVIGRGWCATHYYRWKRHGDVFADRPKIRTTKSGEAAQWFQDHVLTCVDDECLFWPYARFRGGYAAITIKGRRRNVHRAALEITGGPAPSPEHVVAHSCGKGRQGCCNPKHLRWDTVAGNEADKVSHGTIAKGEKHPLSILTEADVRSIRSAAGTVSQTDLARKFGVKQSTVANIVGRRSWRHVA